MSEPRPDDELALAGRRLGEDAQALLAEIEKLRPGMDTTNLVTLMAIGIGVLSARLYWPDAPSAEYLYRLGGVIGKGVVVGRDRLELTGSRLVGHA